LYLWESPLPYGSGLFYFGAANLIRPGLPVILAYAIQSPIQTKAA
jgi:hypothetical protein